MKEKLFKSPLTRFGVLLLALLFLIGLFAPLLASSLPLALFYEGKIYFPLFRYLFFKGFYTKEIDLFFNALMVASPLVLIAFIFKKRMKKGLFAALLGLSSLLTLSLFALAMVGAVKDPTYSRELILKRNASRSASEGKIYFADFNFELELLSDYEKVRELASYKLKKASQKRLEPYIREFEKRYEKRAPTLFYLEERERSELAGRLKEELSQKLAQLDGVKKGGDSSLRLISDDSGSEKGELKRALQEVEAASSALSYAEEKARWLEQESGKMHALYALLRPFHWQEDAGGSELFNRSLPFYEVTRPSRKDLAASLIFGIRISIVVGLLGAALALIIGVPFGLISGYLGGKVDLALFRIIEVWESMPSFFMLLLIIAITHVKSIFLVIGALGFFGWTTFARFIRAETLRERSKAYVMAATSMGFGPSRIIFSEVMPNAIFPVLALLPFTMMGAISAEAALSFLGLGEENSTSIGSLMSEARAFFPGESYLLWPPAIIISLLLIAFALIGDGLRTSFDPKSDNR